MMSKKIMFLFFLILSSSIVSAVPGTWRGSVTINGTNATSGTVVEGYVAGVLKQSTTTGADEVPSNYYVLNLVGSEGQNVTFKVYGVDAFEGIQNWSLGTHDLDLSINKTADGTSCTYNGGCTSGYCVDGYCCNNNCTGTCNLCNVTGSLGTCTDVNTLCGGSSSSCYCSSGSCVACSGGYTCSGYSCVSTGGAGTPPSPGPGVTTTTTTIPTTTTTIPLAKETKTVSSIEANTSATITFLKEDELCIQEIEISVENDVANVSITLEETTKPEEADIAIAIDVGAVYKYLSIEKTNIENGDISEAKIKFKVEKSWIIANSIDPDTIILKRLVGDAWVELPTVKVSEDDTYYYYEAVSTGFSVFAITGEKVLPVCGNNIKEAGEECDGTDLAGETCVSLGYASGTLSCKDCKFDTSNCIPAPPTIAFLYLIIIAIVIVGFYLFIRGKRKKEPHHHLHHE